MELGAAAPAFAANAAGSTADPLVHRDASGSHLHPLLGEGGSGGAAAGAVDQQQRWAAAGASTTPFASASAPAGSAAAGGPTPGQAGADVFARALVLQAKQLATDVDTFERQMGWEGKRYERDNLRAWPPTAKADLQEKGLASIAQDLFNKVENLVSKSQPGMSTLTGTVPDKLRNSLARALASGIYSI